MGRVKKVDLSNVLSSAHVEKSPNLSSSSRCRSFEFGSLVRWVSFGTMSGCLSLKCPLLKSFYYIRIRSCTFQVFIRIPTPPMSAARLYPCVRVEQHREALLLQKNIHPLSMWWRGGT